MELGISVQIAWPLAAEEAVAGCADEIAPGHVLCATLKLVEMAPSAFRDALPKQELLDSLKEELSALAETFSRKGIGIPEGSTALRRKLRAFLREGNRGRPPNRSGLIHRSAITKNLFDLAEEAARNNGAKILGIDRLVEMLFEHPDPRLEKAFVRLGMAGMSRSDSDSDMALDWVDRVGCNLTERIREAHPDPAGIGAIRCDAVCKVLAEALFAGDKGKHPPVMLVSCGKRTSAAVVRDLSLWVVSQEPPSGTRRGCIIKIDSAKVLDRCREETPEARLEDLFLQVKGLKNIVLFFDNLHRYLSPDLAGNSVARHFKTLLKAQDTPCVLGITQKQYEVNASILREWNHILKLIWIHDIHAGFSF